MKNFFIQHKKLNNEDFYSLEELTIKNFSLLASSADLYGYIIFYNKFIFQWGYGACSANNLGVYSYNIIFPNYMLSIYGTPANFQIGAVGTEKIAPICCIGNDLNTYRAANASSNTSLAYFWFVIGI